MIPLGYGSQKKCIRAENIIPAVPTAYRLPFLLVCFIIYDLPRNVVGTGGVSRRPCRDDHLSSGEKPSSSSARASWSGHDVGFAPQRIPRRRSTTSSAFIPRQREATPCVFPEQPPMNFTDFTVSPSSSISISREQVPCVVYLILFMFFRFRRRKLPFCLFLWYVL